MRTEFFLLALLFPVILLACPDQVQTLDDDDATATAGDDDDASATPVPTPPPTPPPGPLTITITNVPLQVVEGELLIVEALVTSSEVTPINVTLLSDVQGSVGSSIPDANGDVSIGTTALLAGWHTLTLVAVQGVEQATDDAVVGVCLWPAVEDFTTAPTGDWQLFFNAFWEPQGWVEMTGNVGSSRGAIFNTTNRINPGDFAMEFDIATGGGTGADGFAVSVINAMNATDLESIISSAGSGGCLGYGFSGPCGSTARDAFHIEFDTFENSIGMGHGFDDPTSENHIAINLDGDPGPHYLWAAVPTLEDLQWRHISIDILGDHVLVEMDNNAIIDDVITGFQFEGGYIGVSGTTGWDYNFHRFDNLQLWDSCSVP